MDSNKDEANRAIDIAIAALDDGNYQRADKFLKKAEKLYPSSRAKDLLDQLQSSGTEKIKRTLSNENLSRKREDSAKSNGTDEAAPPEIEYSSDQVELVKKIKKCKDYYEALGVSKDAPDSEIRKAYKKLALQLHPDKNKAPGAVESFKAIGNAVAILTDPEKRKQYDLYGNEEITTRRTPQYSTYGFSRGFEADGTTEEIFNMFFGGGFPQQNNMYMRQRRFHRAEQREQQQQQQNGYAAFINLLPIILLVGLSMVSSFFMSDPIYSLTPSQKFSVVRKTNALKIQYYVKENFHTEYQGSVGRLETSVEEEYLNNLKHACYRERNYKDSMLNKARNFGDRDLYQKAQNIATPSCERLHILQNM